MTWRIRERTLDLSVSGLVMGILNTTPDSFSDGGRWTDVSKAVEHALAMVADGAGIIDVGGESTRPGALPVDTATEVRRTAPVIAALREHSTVPISIDTSKAAVADAALDAGADIVNDVTGLRGDAEMAGVVAAAGAGLVLMHMQGEPETMQATPEYRDVAGDVGDFLAGQLAIAEEAGVDRPQVVVDPGIGFGKSLGHNLELLRRLGEVERRTGRPLLLGVSRKSFIGKILGSPDTEAHERDWPTVALTSFAREKGVRIVRVHDVLRNTQALRMTEAVLSAGDPGDALL